MQGAAAMSPWTVLIGTLECKRPVFVPAVRHNKGRSESNIARGEQTKANIVAIISDNARSINELMDELGMSKSGVQNSLKKLEADGIVKREKFHKTEYWGMA